MARMHFFQATDPTAPDEERFLGVYFVVDSYGYEPCGHGEHFDPGSGPEFTIASIQDDTGRLVELADDQFEAVEAEIREEFDFRAAAREEREQDDELTLLVGFL